MNEIEPKPSRILLAEVRESFRMAMGAIAAHKLRSALTLLGVLVGVFSIIVVMTAMRVMQSNIERQLSSLGSQTFMVRKWPALIFGGSGGDSKNTGGAKTSRCGRANGLQEKADAAREHRHGDGISGPAKSRRATRPARRRCGCYGETPGSFPAHNWNLRRRPAAVRMRTWTARAMSACSGSGLATNIFPEQLGRRRTGED